MYHRGLLAIFFCYIKVFAYTESFTPLKGISTEKSPMRQGGSMPGGWNEVTDLNSQDILDAANWCVSQMNRTGTTTHSVVSARRQIVAGTKYALTLALTDTATNTCTTKGFVIVKKLILNGVAPDPPYVLLESDSSSGAPCSSVAPSVSPGGQ